METMATDSINPTVDIAEAPSAPELDIRSDADRAADEAMGATEQSAEDRAIAKIVEAADKLFNNTKATRKYLALGELCYDYVYKATDGGQKSALKVISGDKSVALRAKIVDRIEDRVRGVAGVQAASVRVNDWIQVYWLSRCLTGISQVKDMPSEWVESISYHALADLKSKTMTHNHDESWSILPEWVDKVKELVRLKVRGEMLLAAMEAHRAKLTSDLDATLTDEQREAKARKDARAERRKADARVEKGIDRFEDLIQEAGLSPKDLQAELTKRKLVPPAPEPEKVPMDLAEMARTMTPQDATALVEFLRMAGNGKAIAMLFAQTSKIMQAQQPAKSQAA